MASTAQSQPERLELQLGNNKLTLRDRTFNLLTQATTWAAFSNDGFQGNRSNPIFYDSLESIHGQIHGLTGQNGHMSVVDFAAFDPVFVRVQVSHGVHWSTYGINSVAAPYKRRSSFNNLASH